MRISSVSAKKNIGSILRERRIKKAILQSEMSREAGISQTFLSLVEHGRRVPSYDVLRRIAKVLGEDAADLEREAGGADSDSAMQLNHYVKRLLGSGDKRKLKRLLEFIETLG